MEDELGWYLGVDYWNLNLKYFIFARAERTPES